MIPKVILKAQRAQTKICPSTTAVILLKMLLLTAVHLMAPLQMARHPWMHNLLPDWMMSHLMEIKTQVQHLKQKVLGHLI